MSFDETSIEYAQNNTILDSTPLVSIIVPVFNTEKFLEECLNSIRNQTYKNIEIIVINDGSTDNSVNIINKNAILDKRIKVINQENCGVSASRNIGIESAMGKYLLFVDSDDFIEKNTVEQLVKKSEATECDILCFGYSHYYDESNVRREVKSQFRRYRSLPEMPGLFTGLTVEPIAFQIAISSVCTKFWKKSFVNSANLTFQKYEFGEDCIFFITAILENAKLSVYDVSFYNYRRFDTNNTMSRIGRFDSKNMKYLIAVQNEITKRGLMETYLQTYTKKIMSELNMFFSCITSIEEYRKFATFLREGGFSTLGITQNKIDKYANGTAKNLYLHITAGDLPPKPLSKELRAMLRNDKMLKKNEALEQKLEKRNKRIEGLKKKNARLEKQILDITSSRGYKTLQWVRNFIHKPGK